MLSEQVVIKYATGCCPGRENKDPNVRYMRYVDRQYDMRYIKKWLIKYKDESENKMKWKVYKLGPPSGYQGPPNKKKGRK